MDAERPPLTDLLFLVVFCRMVYNIVAGILIFSVDRIRYRKAPTRARAWGLLYIKQCLRDWMTRASAHVGASPVIREKSGRLFFCSRTRFMLFQFKAVLFSFKYLLKFALLCSCQIWFIYFKLFLNFLQFLSGFLVQFC